MPGVEELLDVLPALLVAGARDVRVRELVDEHDVGAAGEHRVDVHLLELGAAVLDLAAGNDLEIAELLGGAGPAVRLDDADHHVGAAVVAAAALVEHRERLADAGCRTEIQTKLAPRHTTSVSHPGAGTGHYAADHCQYPYPPPPPPRVVTGVIVVGVAPPGSPAAVASNCCRSRQAPQRRSRRARRAMSLRFAS